MKSRLMPAVVAGTIAIVINIFALKAADLVPLATARGGLLRLLSLWFLPLLQRIGVASAWSSLGLPDAGSALFQTGFHFVVGVLMAVVYAYLIEPFLALSDIAKGLAYGTAVWLLNAFVILPMTGEGLAGAAHLQPAGMAWFAVAHFLFFVIFALLYGGLRRNAISAARTA
jgi:uncharacterized membrane protein YagU involved in acid resistance